MANVIYTIPDHLLDLAYQAWYGSPNSDLFTRNQLQRKPIPPLGLDNLALWTSDALQDLSETLAGINREKIGVEGQKLELLYFSDDEGTLQAISLQDLMNSLLAPLALDGSNIGKETIYGTSLRKNTLKKDNYGLQSIETEAMKDLAVTAGKLFGQIPLSKMISSGKKCLLMGTEGSNAYTEKVANNESQPWYVFCNNPNAASIALNSLVDIWLQTPYTFTGIKLTDKTVNLTKLLTEATGGFLISGAGNTGVEILPVLDTDYWKIAVRTSASGGKVILKGLPEICANYANSIDASCLRQNTVTLAKLAQDVLTAIRDNNFATATVSINGTLLRKKNVASVTKLGTGQYRVNFASQPPSGLTTYNVQISIGGTYSCSWENKTLNSVEVHIYTTTRAYDAPFDIVISDAGT